MTKEEKEKELEGFELVKHKIGWEGFHYCFEFYSDFKKEIKDEKFHELREGYLNNKVSRKVLNDYIESKIIELKKAS